MSKSCLQQGTLDEVGLCWWCPRNFVCVNCSCSSVRKITILINVACSQSLTTDFNEPNSLQCWHDTKRSKISCLTLILPHLASVSTQIVFWHEKSKFSKLPICPSSKQTISVGNSHWANFIFSSAFGASTIASFCVIFMWCGVQVSQDVILWVKGDSGPNLTETEWCLKQPSMYSQTVLQYHCTQAFCQY